MPTRIKVIGLEKLQRKLGPGRLTEPAKREIIRKGGILAESTAETLAPRATGALVNSISLSVREDGAKVSTGLYYARFLEHGTKHIRPRRFMARAKTRVTRELKNLITAAIRDIERVWGAA